MRIKGRLAGLSAKFQKLRAFDSTCLRGRLSPRSEIAQGLGIGASDRDGSDEYYPVGLAAGRALQTL